MPLAPWTDDDSERIISNILRAGVILSSAITLFGGIWYLQRHGAEIPHYRVFHGEPSDLRNVPGVLHEAFQPRPRGMVQLGLLFLIATPITRVAFSVYAFSRQHDKVYVGVTLLVLTLLLTSLAGH